MAWEMVSDQGFKSLLTEDSDGIPRLSAVKKSRQWTVFEEGCGIKSIWSLLRWLKLYYLPPDENKFAERIAFFFFHSERNTDDITNTWVSFPSSILGVYETALIWGIGEVWEKGKLVVQKVPIVPIEVNIPHSATSYDACVPHICSIWANVLSFLPLLVVFYTFGFFALWRAYHWAHQ